MSQVLILEETTKNPITLMGSRAGICWGSDISDREKNYKRGLECLTSGHGRVMEYVNVEMVLDGYSARVVREWYTHIGGSPTRLQASTRYVDYSHFSYVVPPAVAQNEKARVRYEEMMHGISETCAYLEQECGIAREDAAMLLPLGMTTKIVDKRNLRNLVDMSRQRMCERAYHEYRRMFLDISKALAEYSQEWDYLVKHYFLPKCQILGYCPETHSCGQMPKRQTI
ncbi:Flavin-dependent thymidylate synthase [Eubacterium plexicaudatum ASF492]|uniref:Thymidylate synthase, flavin-dependent n=1 Tax=Eubacterium plexicaudatum ASF492 TaxID=1235802 RepID=N2AEE7_9FIRM|nr:Flavin-dependent thymidylate synthase [Eubacterium plexicaudatum ASF492]